MKLKNGIHSVLKYWNSNYQKIEDINIVMLHVETKEKIENRTIFYPIRMTAILIIGLFFGINENNSFFGAMFVMISMFMYFDNEMDRKIFAILSKIILINRAQQGDAPETGSSE